MRLEKWLEDEGVTPTELARRIERHSSTILRIIPDRKGNPPRRKPSLELLGELKLATGGAVTADDYLDA